MELADAPAGDPQAALVALVDPTRRALLEALAAAPTTVGALAATACVSRSAVSQHLKVLLEAGVVTAARSGRCRTYRVRGEGLGALAGYLDELRAQLDDGSRPLESEESRRVAARQGDEPTGCEPRGVGGDRVDVAVAEWARLAPDDDPEVVAMAARLLLIGRYISRSMDRLAADVGLLATDVVILRTLQRTGPYEESSPASLADRSLLSPPGMAKRLAHLERMGLVRRWRGTHGREIVVRLTGAGRALLGEVTRRAAKQHHAVLTLPDAEFSCVAQGLRELLRRTEGRTHGGDALRRD